MVGKLSSSPVKYRCCLLTFLPVFYSTRCTLAFFYNGNIVRPGYFLHQWCKFRRHVRIVYCPLGRPTIPHLKAILLSHHALYNNYHIAIEPCKAPYNYYPLLIFTGQAGTKVKGGIAFQVDFYGSFYSGYDRDHCDPPGAGKVYRGVFLYFGDLCLIYLVPGFFFLFYPRTADTPEC